MKQVALIDIGSNTIRLVVYELANPASNDAANGCGVRQDEKDNDAAPTELSSKIEAPTRLFSKKRMVGLADYVDEHNNLSEAGVLAACDALRYLQKFCDVLHVQERYFFATASLRNIDNSKQVRKSIENACGISIDLISNEDEALLGYAAFKHDAPFEDGVLCDIGGGSAELVCFARHHVQTAFSMPLGSLKLFKRHVGGILPTKPEVKAMRQDTLKMIQEYCDAKMLDLENDDLPDGSAHISQLCAIGGSARAIRKLANDLHELDKDNKRLSQKQIKDLLELLVSGNKKARKLILRNCPDRVHTIVPGLIILEEIIETFNVQRIYISNYGVREGYLYERVL